MDIQTAEIVLDLFYFIFAGEAISVLDGVPVAIKDEIDCLPYPTTGIAFSCIEIFNLLIHKYSVRC